MPRYATETLFPAVPTHILFLQFFTCGARKVAIGVRDALTAIIKNNHKISDDEAAALFQRATLSRYATDIFD